MVDDYSFNKFCELLSDEVILKTSTAFGVAKQFQTYIADIKSQVLKELMNRTENQDVYLDFLINEIEKQEYIKDAGLRYIERWLKEYDTTIEDILERSDFSEPTYAVLARHYNDMEPFSEEKDKAHLVQTDFLNYFCCLYANELIGFLKSKKPKPKKQEVIPPTNSKPFKDEYLIAFCKEISDERVIKESSFMQQYEYGITHFAPYLESEITENLLIIDKDKKEDYLNYVLDKINKTPYATISEDFIDRWIKEYKIDSGVFPSFSNKELEEMLNKSYSGYHNEPHEQFAIEDIQIDFYCYACMLEVKKIINYLERKGMKNIKKEVNKKEDIEFEKLDAYSKLIHLFSDIDNINFNLNKERVQHYSEEEIDETHIIYDIEREPFEQQIKELIDKLQGYSLENNFYYFDSPSAVYINHFQKRKESFFFQIPDANELDFLLSEVEYFSQPHKNRVLNDKYKYDMFVSYSNIYKIALRRKLEYLNSHLAKYNYIIDWEENVEIFDSYYNTKTIYTKIKLEKLSKDLSNSSESSKLVKSGTKLKWTGKKAHLGFIIGTLADLGYLQGPERPNGEINYSEFARNILEVFDCDTTEGTLSKYLNVTSDKSEEVSRNFQSANFHIPHSKDVS
jgi:hypothetical protein